MKYYLSFIFFYITICVNAQSFTAKVNRDSILLGNNFKATFTIENIDGNFEAPSFKDFEIVSGPNLSTSMQIINGESSSQIAHSYYLKPKEIGTFYLPPAYVIAEESSLETEPIEINVYPNPEHIIQEDKERTEGFFFDFSSPFDKKDIFKDKIKKEPKKKERVYKKI